MTVLKTAYDTTACRDFVMKKTTDALAVAMAHGQVRTIPSVTDHRVYQIEGGASVVDDVPAFAHPILLAEPHRDQDPDHQPTMVIDVRTMGKWDQHQAQFNVRNTIEYSLLNYRARLNYVWVTEAQSILRDISPLPMAVFSSWISEALARRYALDPQEQLDLAILAAIWYNSQFTDSDALNEREKLSLVNAVSRNLRIQASLVLDKMETIPVVTSVAHFCELASQVTGSVRLQELNAGVMFAVLGGTWFGNREMVCVALEHPPTWIAILLAAVTERTYKNSAIAKLTERNVYRNMSNDFVRCVRKLLDVTLDQH